MPVGNRPAPRRSRAIAIAFWALSAAACWPQGPDELVACLASPFAAERDGAVEALIALPPDPTRLLAALTSTDPRARAGAGRVLARMEVGAETLGRLVEAWRTEPDRVVKLQLGEALLTAVSGRTDVDVSATIADTPEGRAAARAFVETELEHLDERGVEWSDHRSFATFVGLGQGVVEALGHVAGDEAASDRRRGLAFIAAARVAGRDFWTSPDGSPSELVRKILDGDDANVTVAMLYGAAYAGVETTPFVIRIARFVRDEAIGQETIQAALYYLYTLERELGADVLPELTSCVLEFSEGYHDVELYNVAQLLKRLRLPDIVRPRFAAMKQEESFATYWFMAALIENLRGAPDELAGPLRREILEWGLAEERVVPQIRAAAWWFWQDAFGEPPVGVELAPLLSAVRESTATDVANPNVDADNYAQRSGVDVLALFRDELAGPVIGGLLTHHNEAVRMAAAMSAGQGGFRDLVPGLEKLMHEKEEFASFGAAYGLKLLGIRSCLGEFAALVGSGNHVLMGPALFNLREMTGHRFADESPDSPAAWRERAARWTAWLAEQER